MTKTRYTRKDVVNRYALELHLTDGEIVLVQIPDFASGGGIPSYGTPRYVIEHAVEQGYFAINTLGEWTTSDIPNEVYPMTSIRKFEVLSN